MFLQRYDVEPKSYVLFALGYICLAFKVPVNVPPVVGNPEPAVAKEYYRCVLVVDFVMPYKLQYYRSRNLEFGYNG